MSTTSVIAGEVGRASSNVSLRTLMAEPVFKLGLVVAGDADVLDRDIAWVHSSDLGDPTPWLEPGQLLLTDGMQFTGEMSDELADRRADEYVRRLSARGVLALGFATGIIHIDIPQRLVDACDRHGFTLLEVGERTPFIGIIRFVADAVAAARVASLEWSLAAQRAVARAALRPDGLTAILAELGQQLGCWVALYDALGNRVTTRTREPVPEGVEAAVAEVLRRGSRAGLHLADGAEGATLLTLGRRGELRGILAVGSSVPLDHAEHDLVSSVIGLASIALEQHSALDLARRQLRSGLLELLLSGDRAVAERTAQRLWGPLPPDPIRVAVVDIPEGELGFLSELDVQAAAHGGKLFFAEQDERIVIVSSDADTGLWDAVVGRHGLSGGVSARTSWEGLRDGLAEAERARASAGETPRLVRYEALAEQGLLGLLSASGGEVLANRLLEPLGGLGAEARAVHMTTARVWLEANCVTDQAAGRLGIHRQTLRARIGTLESLLDLDLSRFADRAELWSALQLADG
ncbi:PucR family transcriptional regulator [Plantibacter sp. MCCC 1A11337]|uniref:PucR family transcriptional regulator n=1 Tax=Plantibacter sp. MCCC 1A11337 TaxID=2736644 RepID=UPI001581AC2F|nr:PucR family transcriptional regulator [Plantibacter sp. MCCC 1A11337]